MSDNRDERPENTEKKSPTEAGETSRAAENASESATQKTTASASAHVAENGAAAADNSSAASAAVDLNKIPEPEAAYPEKTPEEEGDKSEDLGALNGFFNGCARVAPIMLLIFLCAAIWPEFWRGDGNLFCPPESATISAYLRCAAQDAWVAPLALQNGAWLSPQWPGVYWLMALLDMIPGVTPSLTLALTGAINAAILLLAIWSLCVAARFGYRAAFAAALVAFCSPLIVPSAHFVGAGALAAGLSIFSIACFSRGWLARRAVLSLPCGFIFCALAGLCGGTLFLLVPLASSFIFLIWRADARRAQSIDALIGFVLFLAVLGVWFALLTLGEQPEGYFSALFAGHWDLSWPPHARWWAPLLICLLGTMPWTLEIFGVSWLRVMGRSGKTLAASRKDNGSAMVWISLVLAAAASVFMTHPQWGALFTHGLLAALLGKAFVNLSSAGNRFFFLLAGLLLCVIGLALLGVSFSFSQGLIFGLLPIQLPPFMPALLLSLSALPILGALVLVGGLVTFLFVRKDRGAGGLIYAVILLLILAQPAMLMLTPELAASPDTRLVTLAQIRDRVAGVPMLLGAPNLSPSEPPAPAPAAPIVPEPTTPQTAEPTAPAIEAPRLPVIPDEITRPVAPEAAPPVAPAIPPAEENAKGVAPESPASKAPETPQPEQGTPLVPPDAAPNGGEVPAAPDDKGKEQTLPQVIEDIIVKEETQKPAEIIKPENEAPKAGEKSEPSSSPEGQETRL